jgi:hypothetical protein
MEEKLVSYSNTLVRRGTAKSAFRRHVMFRAKAAVLNILLLLFALAGPCFALHNTHGIHGLAPSDNPSQSTKKRVPTRVAADNETENISDAATPSQQGEVQEPESKSGGDDSRAKSKDSALKDFIPTEKIPADQAVDFPTDI